MKTEKLLRDVLRCLDTGFEIQPNSAYHREIKKVIAEIDANPPRVEGFPEAEFSQLVAKLPPVVREHCEVTARWGFAQGRLAPKPAPKEDMERQRDAYAKAMAVALEDGIFPDKAATKKKIEDLLRDYISASQPAPDERKGDRGRAWGFAMDVFKSAGMSPDNPLFAHIQKCMMQHLCAQAPTEPTREQVAELVEAAREVVKWIHYSPYRSALEKALAPFAEKGGS